MHSPADGNRVGFRGLVGPSLPATVASVVREALLLTVLLASDPADQGLGIPAAVGAKGRDGGQPFSWAF